MRAVFTVKLEGKPSGAFPSDEEVISVLRDFGWEPRSGPFWEYFCDRAADCPIDEQAAAEERVRSLWYSEQGHRAFDSMPELKPQDPERDSVIYFGRLAETDTEFVVTRLVMGELKFRLLQPELIDLQSATDQVIKSVLPEEIFGGVVRSKVVVYETGQNHVLLTGEVIANALREAYRRDSRDVALTIVPLLLFIVMFPVSHAVAPELRPDIASLIDRFSTAMLTTSIVSALGFLNILFRLRRESAVIWEYGR